MRLKLMLAIAAAMTVSAAPAHASLATYSVQETFMEPAYGGTQNTVFNGTFTYDSISKKITNLTGTLSEAMTAMMNGGTQKLLNLSYNPVASTVDASGGITAHAFLLNNTSIYLDGAYDTGALMKLGGINGPIANAYATIYVSGSQLSGANPFLSTTGFSHLYYGDCQPGGMMGPMCMTGWGTKPSGSMGAYVLSEKVTLTSQTAVPLPPAVWTFLSGMFSLLFFGKKRNSPVMAKV